MPLMSKGIKEELLQGQKREETRSWLQVLAGVSSYYSFLLKENKAEHVVAYVVV